MEYLKIPVIIPSLEPDERLTILLARMQAAGIRNVLLVDDGSGPAYMPIFARAEQEFGCRLLRHAVNMGKGRALKDAFNMCLLIWPDAPGCVTADSDGQHDTACILRCMQALSETPDALILGVRDFQAPQVPFNSRWGNRITRMVFSALCGVRVSDTQTGLRAIPAAFMKRLLTVPGERFEFESNMLLETRETVPIREIPITTIYDSREHHASHFHPLRDSLRIYAVFGRFIISSLSSTAADLALFGLFVRLLAAFLPVWYIAVSTGLARICSALLNFALNHRIVFRSEAKLPGAALRYAVLCLFQTAASAALVTLLFRWLGGSELAIKIPVDLCLFFFSFQIQRTFVFAAGPHGRRKKQPL